MLGKVSKDRSVLKTLLLDNLTRVFGNRSQVLVMKILDSSSNTGFWENDQEECLEFTSIDAQVLELLISEVKHPDTLDNEMFETYLYWIEDIAADVYQQHMMHEHSIDDLRSLSFYHGYCEVLKTLNRMIQSQHDLEATIIKYRNEQQL